METLSFDTLRALAEVPPGVLRALKDVPAEALSGLHGARTQPSAASTETPASEPDSTPARGGFTAEQTGHMVEALEAAAEGRGSIVAYFGAYSWRDPDTGRGARWQHGHFGTKVQDLLELPEYKVAQVLAVLGSEVRLAILRSLLHSAKTAAELVTELGLGSTGRAYHHLRELENAGYLEQREGRYSIQGPFVEVYLTALALSANALHWAPPEIERGDEATPAGGNG